MHRRRSEVKVNDDDGHHYGRGDEHHDKEEIFADQRRGQRRRRVDLDDQQQEDVERVEDRDAHRDLLAAGSRQVEDEDRHRTDGDARQNQVDGVVQRLSSDGDVEFDIGVGFGTARVVLDVLLRLDRQQIPLGAFLIVVQVDSFLDHQHVVDVLRQVLVPYLDGVFVVRPRTDLDGAHLFVERKELDVDRAQAFVDRRRLPDYQTIRMNGHLGLQLHRKVTVSAEDTYTVCGRRQASIL